MGDRCPLAAWKSGIGLAHLFVGSPAHARELDALAYAAHRCRLIDCLTLAEMLEMVEAAEMWAALQMEEGYEIGLFHYDLPDTENVDYRQGNGWWKSKRGN